MKKDNGKIKEHNRKKILYILGVAACLILLFAVLAYRIKTPAPTETVEYDGSLNVTWDGKKYKGSYEGSYSNSKPSGEGTFVADDGAITYEGSWKNGKFSGNGIITYEDGTFEKGSYSSGKREGICQLYDAADTYAESVYEKNVPYGKRYTYKNKELTGVDLYANGTLVSQIKENAIRLTSKVVQKMDYADQYVFVDGVVCSVAQDEKICYFRIDTDSAGMIIGSYQDTNGRKSRQSIMPNMKAGDRVRLYGQYLGTVRNKVVADEEGYGYDYASINPVYGELADAPIKDLETLDYQTMVNYPYLHMMEKLDAVMVVERVIRFGKNYYIVANKKQQDESSTETYVLFYKGTWSDAFITGSEIEVKGYYDGQYRILDGSENSRYAEYLEDEKDNTTGKQIVTFLYDSFPMIQVEEIVK